MAYATPRSANRELDAGSTDGKYRKINADRGGFVEATTSNARRDLTDGWYGLHEAPVMVTPDNRHITDPYAVSMPEAPIAYF
jgi:hypothetical protein